MTLLHQAAQKAVEALEQVTTSETFYRDPRGDRAGPAIDALESALQQQPEPVALKDGVPNTEAAIAYALERWGYRQGTKECIAFYRGACWCVLAAAPSTPENDHG